MVKPVDLAALQACWSSWAPAPEKQPAPGRRWSALCV